jgi:hypothetical protein
VIKIMLHFFILASDGRKGRNIMTIPCPLRNSIVAIVDDIYFSAKQTSANQRMLRCLKDRYGSRHNNEFQFAQIGIADFRSECSYKIVRVLSVWYDC